MKIVHLLTSSMQIEPPSNQKHHTFAFRFKGEQHVGLKIDPMFKKRAS